jgi:hypothetical protein
VFGTLYSFMNLQLSADQSRRIWQQKKNVKNYEVLYMSTRLGITAKQNNNHSMTTRSSHSHYLEHKTINQKDEIICTPILQKEKIEKKNCHTFMSSCAGSKYTWDLASSKTIKGQPRARSSRLRRVQRRV